MIVKSVMHFPSLLDPDYPTAGCQIDAEYFGRCCEERTIVTIPRDWECFAERETRLELTLLVEDVAIRTRRWWGHQDISGGALRCCRSVAKKNGPRSRRLFDETIYFGIDHPAGAH